MTDKAMTEWRQGLRYRVFFGFARRYLDGVTFSTYAREGARGIPADAILAEVARVADVVDRQDLNAMEFAIEAVEDARGGDRGGRDECHISFLT